MQFKILIPSILFAVSFMCVSANESQIKHPPRWVKLLRQNKHYFKTIKRVDRYFAHHYVPLELEDDKPQQQVDPRRWIVKVFQSEEVAKTKSNDLLMEFKYFKRWKFEMEPFVKGNGTIMTEEERIAAWQSGVNHK